MKKYIAIILAVIMFAVLACGCTSNGTNGDDGTNAATPVVKKEVILKDVDTAQFPNAREYDIYSWPTLGIASEIPAPLWSNRGAISYESADEFSCLVGYTTKENYSNYVKELQDFGFVKYYESSSIMYYAETEDGWAIWICYSESNYSMSIALARDFEELGIRDVEEKVDTGAETAD